MTNKEKALQFLTKELEEIQDEYNTINKYYQEELNTFNNKWWLFKWFSFGGKSEIHEHYCGLLNANRKVLNLFEKRALDICLDRSTETDYYAEQFDLLDKNNSDVLLANKV